MFSILRCCINKGQTMSITKIISRRYMKVSEKMEFLLKRSDHIPKDYTLIYRHPSYKGASMMYHSTVLLGCFTIGTLGYLYYNEFENNKGYHPVKSVENPLQAGVILIIIIGAIIFSDRMRSRYTMRVYYNDKIQQFRAIFISRVPFTREFHDFPKESLTYVAKGSVIPWKSDLYDANGRKMMLFEDKFRTFKDLEIMLKPGEL